MYTNKEYKKCLDFFELSIDNDESSETLKEKIKKKYKKLASKYHPDKLVNGTEEEVKNSLKKMLDINVKNDYLLEHINYYIEDLHRQSNVYDNVDLNNLFNNNNAKENRRESKIYHAVVYNSNNIEVLSVKIASSILSIYNLYKNELDIKDQVFLIYKNLTAYSLDDRTINLLNKKTFIHLMDKITTLEQFLTINEMYSILMNNPDFSDIKKFAPTIINESYKNNFYDEVNTIYDNIYKKDVNLLYTIKDFFLNINNRPVINSLQTIETNHKEKTNIIYNIIDLIPSLKNSKANEKVFIDLIYYNNSVEIMKDIKKHCENYIEYVKYIFKEKEYKDEEKLLNIFNQYFDDIISSELINEIPINIKEKSKSYTTIQLKDKNNQEVYKNIINKINSNFIFKLLNKEDYSIYKAIHNNDIETFKNKINDYKEQEMKIDLFIKFSIYYNPTEEKKEMLNISENNEQTFKNSKYYNIKM